jgi:hypothetical protein
MSFSMGPDRLHLLCRYRCYTQKLTAMIYVVAMTFTFIIIAMLILRKTPDQKIPLMGKFFKDILRSWWNDRS